MHLRGIFACVFLLLCGISLVILAIAAAIPFIF